MYVTEGALTLCGEHTTQYAEDVLLNRTVEAYVILLTSVTPIRLIKKKNRSSGPGLSGAG